MNKTDVPDRILKRLPNNEKWLVTGVAGFIGSNILECLLRNDQVVIGVDNFSTGSMANLQAVSEAVGAEKWERFEFVEGDLKSQELCEELVRDVSFVLHQAALGSVPRSIENPIGSNESNVTAFLNILDASRRSNVQRFVYAASSSTYGDSLALPKQEDVIGHPLSPYAVTKLVNELYAQTYSKLYGIQCIGLRYFNVFGYRQNPDGAYAAVIPRWVDAVRNHQQVYIDGDGQQSRDFCFVTNAVQANLCAVIERDAVLHPVYNVACGQQTSLLEIFQIIKDLFAHKGISYELEPIHRDPRRGDVRHSLADISRAKSDLGFVPEVDVRSGLAAYVSTMFS